MAKPSPSKSFNKSIFPIMKLDGFYKLDSKSYARTNEELLQWVAIYVDGRLRRSFIVEYGTMIRSSPKFSFVKRIGGNFSKLSSGGSYGAFSESALEKSIERLKVAYQEEVKPILDQQFSVRSYLQCLYDYINGSPEIAQSGHEDFELACCYAVLGEFSKASEFAIVAKKKYSKIAFDWAQEATGYAYQLELHCKQGSRSILDDWKSLTDAALKLDR